MTNDDNARYTKFKITDAIRFLAGANEINTFEVQYLSHKQSCRVYSVSHSVHSVLY